MKNKKISILLIAVMLFSVLLIGMTACNNEITTPTNLGLNGDTISWDMVESAEGYYVTVYKGDQKIGEVLDVKNTYCNLTLTEVGVYTIEVSAYANNKVSSTTSIQYVKSQKIEEPTLVIENMIASWTAVEHAVNYTVTITNSSNVKLYEVTIDSTSFSFDESNVAEADRLFSSVGTYTIKVVANPLETTEEFENSDPVEGKYYVTSKLTVPEISSFSSTSVRWGAISNSLKYRVVVKNATTQELVADYSTNASSCSLSYLGLDESGEYTIQVQALGDGNVYLDSELSQVNPDFNIIVLPKMDLTTNNISLETQEDKTYLKWNGMEDEDNIGSYVVSLLVQKADGTTSLDAVTKTINKTESVEGKYSICLDDLFYTQDEDSISYNYTNEQYYGKTYTISIKAQSKTTTTTGENRVISLEAVTIDETFMSYKVPQKNADGIYQISNVGELAYIRNMPNEKYVLTSDIDCDGYDFLPIVLFKGELDGNNKIIKNMVVTNNEDSQVAAFIEESTGYIKNLVVINVKNHEKLELENVLAVAGLVCVNEGVISNCLVTGTLNVAGASVGGVVSKNMGSGTIESCQSLVNVTGAIAGGLVGINHGTIKSCYATGTIKAEKEVLLEGEEDIEDNYVLNDIAIAGGLVGWAVESTSVISYSFATGAVTASGDDSVKVIAGGLVGLAENSVTIANCYAGKNYTSNTSDRGSVIASGSGSIAGGFVGSADNSSINNCYSTSRASASESVGGFIGQCVGSTQISNCYSTGATSNQGSSKGAFVGYVDPIATFEKVFYYSAFTENWITDSKAEKIVLEQNQSLADAIVLKMGEDSGFTVVDGLVSAGLEKLVYAQSLSITAKPNANIDYKAFVVISSTSHEINRDSEGFKVLGDNTKKGYYIVEYSYTATLTYSIRVLVTIA